LIVRLYIPYVFLRSLPINLIENANIRIAVI